MYSPMIFYFYFLVFVAYVSINVVFILLGIQEIHQEGDNGEEIKTTSYEDNVVLFNWSLYIILIECF